MKPDTSKALDSAFAQAFVRAAVSQGCAPQKAELFLSVKGLAGSPPLSLRKAHGEMSGEGVRRLVKTVQERYFKSFVQAPASQKVRESASRIMSLIETEIPNCEDAVREGLALRGIHVQSPFGVYRWAIELGMSPQVRMEQWRSYSKNHNRALDSGRKTGDPRITMIEALVPVESPAVFDRFIISARRMSRTSGAICARIAAEAYSAQRGIPMVESEAKAMLIPFTISLGRSNGDDWYAFFSCSNEFVGHATSLVKALGKTSFDSLYDSYIRSSRSDLVATDPTPADVLRRVLEVFGFSVAGDEVKLLSKISNVERSISPIMTKMVEVFRELLLTSEALEGSIPRPFFVRELAARGINEITAHTYIRRKGIFLVRQGRISLTDSTRKASVLASPVRKTEAAA